MFRVGIEIDLTSVLESRFTWFCEGDWNWLGFSVRTEIHMFFVRRSKLTLFFCAGRKLLFLQWAWRLTCFWDGRTWLDFSVGDRTWLGYSEGWNGFGCCVGCRKWLHFSVVDQHWLGFCVAVGHNLFLASGSKLPGFLCRGIEIVLILE